MTAEEEGRAKAVKAYKILAGLFGLLGVGLLACGIAAVLNPGSQDFGLPYFIGGFIVGIMTLIAAAICTYVILKAPDADNELKKREVGCAIQGQYILAMFTIMGCFIGCVGAGLGGLSSSSSYYDDDEEEDSPKKTLAIIILVGCIGAIFLTIFSMCVVCTYSSYFGVVIQRGRRGRMVFINTGGSSTMSSTVHAATLQPTPHTSNQVDELEKQNRLLQQQLDLQKQIQQQQQQNQYSGGFYPPPPPPSYGADGSAPEYPPPAYN
ncbi:uncharacterized protein LOC123523965 [Mercenaria mercenaria]|uniref:uncharacterized protein LOC123523965 n=1 Tax=Mercenaria mercenaria TaxID=6596 RepID=UPI00234FA20A|nr:uncharacterized protein LOC123523965 [Mercenaria mercenaria]